MTQNTQSNSDEQRFNGWLGPTQLEGSRARLQGADFALSLSRKNLRCKELLQTIRKDLEPAKKMVTVRIEQRHRHGGSSITGHHLDEFAGVEVAHRPAPASRG